MLLLIWEEACPEQCGVSKGAATRCSKVTSEATGLFSPSFTAGFLTYKVLQNDFSSDLAGSL